MKVLHFDLIYDFFCEKKDEKSIFLLNEILLTSNFLGKQTTLLFYKTNIFYQEYIFSSEATLFSSEAAL